jgi:hypothetical protein
MSFVSWLRNQTSLRYPRGRVQQRPAAPRFRLQLEALEDRWLPSTLIVTNNLGYSTPGSLPYEIGRATNGDKIVFNLNPNGDTIALENPPGTFGGQTQLIINKNLDIEGPGAAKLAIAGAGSRVFEVIPGVQATIAGLTIEHGNAKTGAFDPAGDDGEGGGILNYGTLTLNACTLSGNNAFYGLLANGQGGAIYNAGTMTLSGCTVTGNSASGYGGGIYNAARASLTLLSSTVTGNSAPYGGADLYSLGWVGESNSVIGNSIGRIHHLTGK